MIPAMADGNPVPTVGRARSHLSEAFDTWLRYAEAAEDLVHLTHEGLGRVLILPELYRILEANEGRIEQAEWKAGRAKREIDAGFPTLHAHSLLGLCGALECLVEDIVIASIKHDTGLLSSERFSKVKLPVSVMFGDDSVDRFTAIVTEAARATNADVAVGVTKYERLLDLVGLSGPVPRKVRDALYEAQQIRNVWAHRGGTADRRFVDACPHLGFEVGQRVDMSAEMFLPLMHGMHMYGVVLVNRHLDSRTLPHVSPECVGYEGCLSELPGADSAEQSAATDASSQADSPEVS
jgi:hypothetical protein